VTLQEQNSIWSETESPSIKTYTLPNLRSLPQIQKMSEEEQFQMEVVGNVLPFKTNNYVVEQLIDWNNIPNDPMFVLTFPQKEMLSPHHYEEMASVLKKGESKKQIQEAANKIRLQLNPHPAGQMELNVPTLNDGTKLYGMQHKYKETCLFFPILIVLRFGMSASNNVSIYFANILAFIIIGSPPVNKTSEISGCSKRYCTNCSPSFIANFNSSIPTNWGHLKQKVQYA